jgi:lauroyl/myristoyl acyltransferase
VGAEDRTPGKITWFTRLKFMIVRGFLYGWARCFSLKGLYLFGRAFGFCEWLVNYKRRRRFWQHLAGSIGDGIRQMEPKTRRWACLNYFMRTRADKLFYLIFDKLPRHKILNRVKFHDRHLVDEACARGKGVYVCLSHHGSHHVLILIATILGYKCAGVRDPKEGAMRRYIQQKYEETFPELNDVRLFFADTYPRDIYRTFHDGFIVASALDVGRERGPNLRRAKVRMFDQEREFLTGTMQIALRCGAPVLQGFVVSAKNYYFHLLPMGPLVDPDAPVDDDVLQNAMQRYADNIAQHLLRYPDHISKG